MFDVEHFERFTACIASAGIALASLSCHKKQLRFPNPDGINTSDCHNFCCPTFCGWLFYFPYLRGWFRRRDIPRETTYSVSELFINQFVEILLFDASAAATLLSSNGGTKFVGPADQACRALQGEGWRKVFINGTSVSTERERNIIVNIDTSKTTIASQCSDPYRVNICLPSVLSR